MLTGDGFKFQILLIELNPNTFFNSYFFLVQNKAIQFSFIKTYLFASSTLAAESKKQVDRDRGVCQLLSLTQIKLTKVV
jgi:hypothetical protein